MQQRMMQQCNLPLQVDRKYAPSPFLFFIKKTLTRFSVLPELGELLEEARAETNRLSSSWIRLRVCKRAETVGHISRGGRRRGPIPEGVGVGGEVSGGVPGGPPDHLPLGRQAPHSIRDRRGGGGRSLGAAGTTTTERVAGDGDEPAPDGVAFVGVGKESRASYIG